MLQIYIPKDGKETTQSRWEEEFALEAAKVMGDVLDKLNSYKGWCNGVLEYAKANRKELYLSNTAYEVAMDEAHVNRDMESFKKAVNGFGNTCYLMLKAFKERREPENGG